MTLFSDPSVGIADEMLARAYALAERGRGTTSPNPLVGAVVVADGTVVGEGFHERAGAPHAEAVALDAAGPLSRGADVFVTLEPCNHVGRTPACAARLIAEGVRSVTIGMRDPNEAVSGGGAGALGRAGVAVAFAHDPRPFEQQNEAWLTRMRTGRPFVRVKVALTLDGRPALAPSRRSRITGAGGRDVTMRLRSMATAVAVGAATVDIDDPQLNVRDAADSVQGRSPKRYVLSRTSVPAVGCRMFRDGQGPCTFVTTGQVPAGERTVLERAGVRVLTYAYGDGIVGALRAIADDGTDDLLIEAGPTLLSVLWRERLIDELVVVTAGGMSGNAAPPLYLGRPDAAGGDLAPVFVPTETAIVADDAVTVWRPRPGDPESQGRERG